MPHFIYGTAWKKEATAALVELAVTRGFKGIDTANQPKHYTESLVGEALLSLAKNGVRRESLFLQTKFTPRDGQDHRVPYDENADVKTQVAQSLRSSLEHLHTDYLDSYLLHGPYHHPDLGNEDWAVWGAMEELYRAGTVKRIGISNVNPRQLELLIQNAAVKPMVVQNRCFASRGWDYPVRQLCGAHGIAYQGFSLLTANPQVLADSRVHAIGQRLQLAPEQVVFCFAMQIGMVPLTGTTSATHMQQDLRSKAGLLTGAEMEMLESISL